MITLVSWPQRCASWPVVGCRVMTDPGDLTLAAYAAGVQGYLEHSAAPGPAMQTYLDRLAAVVGTGHVLELGTGHVLELGTGHVLELGSGPGWDAHPFEVHPLPSPKLIVDLVPITDVTAPHLPIVA